MEPVMVDAHLDLAHNARALGRDLTLPLDRLREVDPHPETPLVTLESLREAGVAVVFATLFVDPREGGREDWEEEVWVQLHLYEAWEAQGLVRLVRDGRGLEAHLQRFPQDRVPGLLLLLEGAHALASPEDLLPLRERGLRLLSLTWATGNAYAGGNAEEGPLTERGKALLQAMARWGVALDLSHLAEEAAWQALEVFPGPVCATHANARALVPSPRHLSDRLMEALRERGGVLGLVPFNAFLDPGWKRGDPRLPLEAFFRHKAHAEAILGPGGVGLGTDWDGGFGLEAVPQGLDRHRDLRALGDAGFLGENWIRWLRGWL
ncbi:dipeptidase [Thermus tengchongensis]|uniref:Membrane dipeptidase n=1 Tax=Thermus tengchongensis TaxID=1214928 RepID=A0A4Y9EXN9_9DEIN|nr:membrane dipeptidase [Thermus tengchongensis]TFU15876.1 membrane dipeptidase [Thermus tengchongensis]TFU27136.1 membrane dipeptidase [Thermus tengchongensis]